MGVLSGLIRPVYAPIFFNGTALAMLVPVLPLYLRDEGLSFTAVSVVLAAAGVGGLVGGLPAGSVLTRMGAHALLVSAIAALAITTVLLGLTTAVLALVAFRVVGGVGWVGVHLSCQAHVTENVNTNVRGRAMSFVGGSNRLAYLVGPALGGLFVDLFGFRTTFLIAGLTSASGLVGVMTKRAGPPIVRPEGADGLLVALRRHRRLLLRSGLAGALVMTVRDGRFVVLPLIASEVGLSPTEVGLVVAVGTGADLLLFPISGLIMDRFGRLFAIIPAFSLVAIGLVMLAAGDSPAAVTAAGAVIGVGNGLSAGSLLTLGSDLAPSEATGPFLAGMAAMSNMGRVAGPLIVGWTADAAGLGTAAAVLAAVMTLAILWIALVIGETGTRAELAAAR